MADFRSNRNVLFSCKYHVVFCPKYRKPVLNPPIDAKLKKLIQQVCDETQSALIEMEVMPDHVHLLVGCDPQYGIHRLVKGIKGRSSRVLRQQFRVLRTRIPTLWTNSYIVSSVGGAPLALIAPAEFLERITVNFIRHNLTAYDRALEEVAGRVGIASAVQSKDLLSHRRAIGESYPALADECSRQLMRRGL